MLFLEILRSSYASLVREPFYETLPRPENLTWLVWGLVFRCLSLSVSMTLCFRLVLRPVIRGFSVPADRCP